MWLGLAQAGGLTEASAHQLQAAGANSLAILTSWMQHSSAWDTESVKH